MVLGVGVVILGGNQRDLSDDVTNDRSFNVTKYLCNLFILWAFYQFFSHDVRLQKES